MGRKSQRDEQPLPSTTATVVVVQPEATSSSSTPSWKAKIDRLAGQIAAGRAAPPDEMDTTIDRIRRLGDGDKATWDQMSSKLLEDSKNMHEKLEELIDQATRQCQESSQRQFEQQLLLNKLKADYQSLAEYSNECDSKISKLEEQLSVQREQALEESIMAKKLVDEQKQVITRSQQRISMYAMCTGIKWDDEEADESEYKGEETNQRSSKEVVLQGHAAIPSLQELREFSFAYPRNDISKQYEVANRIWRIVDGKDKE